MTPLDQEQQRTKAESMEQSRARHSFPRCGLSKDRTQYERFKNSSPVDGWRTGMQYTPVEDAAAGKALELISREYERLHKPVIIIEGEEYAKRAYLRRLADIIAGPPHTFTTNSVLKGFLLGKGRYVDRTRINNTVYYNVAKFSKEWRKRLNTLKRTEKVR